MAHAARRSWLDRILNLVGGNKKRPLASRPRLRPSLEALEDRTLLAANITIVAGPAGTGNLDALLDATHGTITTTDDPGDTAATVSTGALAGVGAGVAISIAAGNTIGFNDITSLNLQTGAGTSAAFSTGSVAITFANAANTISTAGGSLSFDAGTNLNIANLMTNGGDVSLSAGTGQIQVDSGASVQTGNGNVILRADAMTISGNVDAANGIVTLTPETSGRASISALTRVRAIWALARVISIK